MGRPATYDEPTATIAARVPASIRAAVSHAAVASSTTLTAYVLAALAGKLEQDGYPVPDLSREPRPSPTWTAEQTEAWLDRREYEAWRAERRANSSNGNGHE